MSKIIFKKNVVIILLSSLFGLQAYADSIIGGPTIIPCGKVQMRCNMDSTNSGEKMRLYMYTALPGGNSCDNIFATTKIYRVFQDPIDGEREYEIFNGTLRNGFFESNRQSFFVFDNSKLKKFYGFQAFQKGNANYFIYDFEDQSISAEFQINRFNGTTSEHKVDPTSCVYLEP